MLSNMIFPLSLLSASVLAAPVIDPSSQPTQDNLHTRGGGGGGCADVTVTFARGTAETGTVGTLAGPPFFDALQDRLGKRTSVNVQGVPYPADIPGFLAGGDAGGSQTMADMADAAATTCPGTSIVLSGYSQGAQLVHNAAKTLPASTVKSIGAVVLFGDPDFPDPVAGVPADKQVAICHDGDNICAGGAIITKAHLTYAKDANDAAAFAVSRLKRN